MPAKTPDPAAKYPVGVRALCEFNVDQGDLDLRHTPSTSAFEGQAGHRIVAGRRGAGYLRELSLSGVHGDLLVRGRADGFDPALGRLEEFKTHRGDLSRVPPMRRRLHWAQLQTYGALACRQLRLPEIELRLVYFEIAGETETLLCERWSAAALQSEFERRCDRFSAWAQKQGAHRRQRNAAVLAAGFPHPVMHPAQRRLAAAAYRTIRDSAVLMAQAPTGSGKTLATLFPALKSLAERDLDKIFFLTAKSAGRLTALEAMRLIDAGRSAVRVLEYSAKQRVCEHPDRDCHGESCPLARGFYDRLPQARHAALTRHTLDRQALVGLAADHRVCPYYLTQELVRWCDVIIADYNYFFDAKAALYALTVENQWRVAVLVDEAHNLLPRARDMYSAALRPDALQAAINAAPLSLTPVLGSLRRTWSTLSVGEAGYRVFPSLPAPLLAAVTRTIDALELLFDHTAAGGATEPTGPSTVAGALSSATASNTAGAISPAGGALLHLYFDLRRFKRAADTFDRHSLFDAMREDAHAVPLLCIRNIVPAVFVAPRLSAATASILFSATLAPEAYCRQLLGVPDSATWLNVASAFDSSQLQVRVATRISTRYADRGPSVAAIVTLMQRQFRAAPGNYLAFFSSFRYLLEVATAFKRDCPDIDAWSQAPIMAAAERDRFLARFAPGGAGIGFAVLGGVFAESIDLPGRRLIGAFIATLGLPQVNPVNAEIQGRLQQLFGSGFEYTYLYPGLQKVVQAAGRIIRGVDDRGVLYLMDDRFLEPRVLRLLPAWWRIAALEAEP
jgi:DNA excision repair protein ERCC-2